MPFESYRSWQRRDLARFGAPRYMVLLEARGLSRYFWLSRRPWRTSDSVPKHTGPNSLTDSHHRTERLRRRATTTRRYRRRWKGLGSCRRSSFLRTFNCVASKSLIRTKSLDVLLAIFRARVRHWQRRSRDAFLTRAIQTAFSRNYLISPCSFEENSSWHLGIMVRRSPGCARSCALEPHWQFPISDIAVLAAVVGHPAQNHCKPTAGAWYGIRWHKFASAQPARLHESGRSKESTGEAISRHFAARGQQVT